MKIHERFVRVCGRAGYFGGGGLRVCGWMGGWVGGGGLEWIEDSNS